MQRNESESSDESDGEETEVDLDPMGPSEHFRKRYRFQPKSIEALCLLFEFSLNERLQS